PRPAPRRGSPLAGPRSPGGWIAPQVRRDVSCARGRRLYVGGGRPALGRLSGTGDAALRRRGIGIHAPGPPALAGGGPRDVRAPIDEPARRLGERRGPFRIRPVSEPAGRGSGVRDGAGGGNPRVGAPVRPTRRFLGRFRRLKREWRGREVVSRIA